MTLLLASMTLLHVSMTLLHISMTLLHESITLLLLSERYKEKEGQWKKAELEGTEKERVRNREREADR